MKLQTTILILTGDTSGGQLYWQVSCLNTGKVLFRSWDEKEARKYYESTL